MLIPTSYNATMLMKFTARSLDEGLQTRQGPLRTFLILARYASRTVYEEALDNLSGSVFLSRHMRVELKLGGYETYLRARAVLGMRKVEVPGVDSFRE
jgi:hypothetical protein